MNTPVNWPLDQHGKSIPPPPPPPFIAPPVQYVMVQPATVANDTRANRNLLGIIVLIAVLVVGSIVVVKVNDARVRQEKASCQADAAIWGATPDQEGC